VSVPLLLLLLVLPLLLLVLQTKSLMSDLEAVSAKMAAAAREHAARSTTLQQRAAKLVSLERWHVSYHLRTGIHHT
jgi:hypothetical protein